MKNNTSNLNLARRSASTHFRSELFRHKSLMRNFRDKNRRRCYSRLRYSSNDRPSFGSTGCIDEIFQMDENYFDDYFRRQHLAKNKIYMTLYYKVYNLFWYLYFLSTLPCNPFEPNDLSHVYEFRFDRPNFDHPFKSSQISIKLVMKNTCWINYCRK